jgi:hypothetical protein
MKRARIALFALLAGMLLANEPAWAMASPGYRLDWLMAGQASGGPAVSATYAVNFSAGQSVMGKTGGPGYAAGLGYWVGALPIYPNFIPAVKK